MSDADGPGACVVVCAAGPVADPPPPPPPSPPPCSLFIIGAIWLFKRYNNFAQRLIFYLSVVSALDTIPYFLGNENPTPGPGCSFQAFWMQYFDWAVLLWVCIISVNIYLNLIHMMETERFETRYARARACSSWLYS